MDNGNLFFGKAVHRQRFLQKIKEGIYKNGGWLRVTGDWLVCESPVGGVFFENLKVTANTADSALFIRGGGIKDINFVFH